MLIKSSPQAKPKGKTMALVIAITLLIIAEPLIQTEELGTVLQLVDHTVECLRILSTA